MAAPKLTITSVTHGDIVAGTEAAHFSDGSTISSGKNMGGTCLGKDLSISYTQTKANSISVSDTLSQTSGIEMSVSTTLTGGALFAKQSVDVGFSAFTEVGKEHTNENTWETSEQLTITDNTHVEIKPYSWYRIVATVRTAKVEASTWQGLLSVRFRSGEQRVSIRLRPVGAVSAAPAITVTNKRAKRDRNSPSMASLRAQTLAERSTP